jgi:hypothetical protein
MLFELYDPSIISISKISITIDSNNQFEKFYMLYTKAKDITINSNQDLD